MSSIKCVFVGNANVGKTHMVHKLLGGCGYNMHIRYVPTFGVDINTIKVTREDGINTSFDIWDCAGNSRYTGLDENYLVLGQIFIVFGGGEGRNPNEWIAKIRKVALTADIYYVVEPSLEQIYDILSQY